MSYQAAKSQLEKLDAKLMKLTETLHDKKKFQPVMKRQWEIAFDNVEKAAIKAMRTNPEQFCADFPERRCHAVFYGLVAP